MSLSTHDIRAIIARVRLTIGMLQRDGQLVPRTMRLELVHWYGRVTR